MIEIPRATLIADKIAELSQSSLASVPADLTPDDLWLLS